MNGQTSQPGCGGVKLWEAAHSGFTRYHDIVVNNTGKDGFQYGSCVENTEVWNLHVTDYATDNLGGHSAGVQINGGSAGLLHTCFIADGPTGDFAYGIFHSGMGFVTVYNNVIARVHTGIIVSDNAFDPVLNSFFRAYNNTFADISYDVFAMYAGRQVLDIQNNILHRDSGGNSYWAGYGGSWNAADTTQALLDNIATTDITVPKFVDPTSPVDNYRLEVGSPAIGTANDVSVNGVDDADQGAYEFIAAPPSILTATIENAAPTDVVMVHDEIVNGTKTGYSLTGTTSSIFASMSGSGTTILTGVLADAALGTEDPLLSYTPGDIVDDDGESLAAFTSIVIQNNVFAAPIKGTIVVRNSNANEWVVPFDIPVTSTTVGWTFKIDGTPVSITGVAGSGTNELIFTSTETILTEETLLASYNPATGDCVAVTGGLELATFTDASVSNAIGAVTSRIDIVWDNGTVDPISPNTGINRQPLNTSAILSNLVDQDNVASTVDFQRTAGSPSGGTTGSECTDARWNASMSEDFDFTSSTITFTISGLDASEEVDLSIFSSRAVNGGDMAYWLQGVKQAEFDCLDNVTVKEYTGIIANGSGEITIEVDSIPVGAPYASINCLGIDRYN